MKHYSMSAHLIALALITGITFWHSSVSAAEFCSDRYYIDVTLPNQARWDMCWEHREREGIVLHKIHYTPADSAARRMVLNEAAVAQIHVPYDDNGARYHDVSDYGLGNRYMVSLQQQECVGGDLLRHGNKQVMCQQVESRGNAFTYQSEQVEGDVLSLFSVSKIGAYNYIPTWRFMDDGSIEPAIGATGALQRYGNASKAAHGWLVGDNKVGIAHLHNFFWKLDFDLAGSRNDDYVEELNFTQSQGRIARSALRYNEERASRVNPQTLRRWRVVDGNVTNNKGLPISYEIRLHQAEHQDTGPAFEPFTQNDLYVTRHKNCELFASHNPSTGGCSDNLASFVNGEQINGQDIVIWPSTTFYHMPRAEDAPRMDAHWSSISITPRDWHDKNPLSNSEVISTVDINTHTGTGSDNNTDAETDTGTGNSDTSGSLNDVVFRSNFEAESSGWTVNPGNTDTASRGLWQIASPQQTTYQNFIMQRDDVGSGSKALVTGAYAGALVGANDVDGGITSIQSAPIALPAGSQYQLKLSYYLAHLRNAGATDYLQISALRSNGTRSVLLNVKGSADNQAAQWQQLNADISHLSGSTIRLLIEAADGGAGSIVEAAIDDISISRTGETGANEADNPQNNTEGNDESRSGDLLYAEGFETGIDWVNNPDNTDSAINGYWQQGIPEATRFQEALIQSGTAAEGSAALLTGRLAGQTVGSHDIDGGKTSIRSPTIRLPADYGYQLNLDYYFAHLWTATHEDYLRVSIESSNGSRHQLLEVSGTPVNRAAQWQALTYDLSEYAGDSIHLLVESADGGAGGIVEAAMDNIRIIYQ